VSRAHGFEITVPQGRSGAAAPAPSRIFLDRFANGSVAVPVVSMEWPACGMRRGDQET